MLLVFLLQLAVLPLHLQPLLFPQRQFFLELKNLPVDDFVPCDLTREPGVKLFVLLPQRLTLLCERLELLLSLAQRGSLLEGLLLESPGFALHLE